MANGNFLLGGPTTEQQAQDFLLDKALEDTDRRLLAIDQSTVPISNEADLLAQQDETVKLVEQRDRLRAAKAQNLLGQMQGATPQLPQTGNLLAPEQAAPPPQQPAIQGVEGGPSPSTPAGDNVANADEIAQDALSRNPQIPRQLAESDDPMGDALGNITDGLERAVTEELTKSGVQPTEEQKQSAIGRWLSNKDNARALLMGSLKLIQESSRFHPGGQPGFLGNLATAVETGVKTKEGLEARRAAAEQQEFKNLLDLQGQQIEAAKTQAEVNKVNAESLKIQNDIMQSGLDDDFLAIATEEGITDLRNMKPKKRGDIAKKAAFRRYFKTNKVDDYTPKSIRAFRQSGDEADLRLSDKAIGTMLSGKDAANVEQSLRNEYTKNSKNWITTSESYQSIISALANKPTGPGDLALIFSFMKSLDPGSVVRESEQQLAITSTGALGRMQAWYEKQRKGTKLSPEEQREQFLQFANEVMSERARTQQNYESSMLGIAKDNGLGDRSGNVVKLSVDGPSAFMDRLSRQIVSPEGIVTFREPPEGVKVTVENGVETYDFTGQ